MNARKRPGQSLIEVTMATMIAAVTTTAVFSVVLSSFVSDARADKRDAAAMSMRRAQEVLKSFVSVDPYNPDMITGDAVTQPGSPVSALGVGRWPADTSGAWALRDGNHNISSLLDNTTLSGGPGTTCQAPACSFSYTVTSYNCAWFGMGSAPDYPTACKRITFSMAYTD